MPSLYDGGGTKGGRLQSAVFDEAAWWRTVDEEHFPIMWPTTIAHLELLRSLILSMLKGGKYCMLDHKCQGMVDFGSNDIHVMQIITINKKVLKIYKEPSLPAT